MRVTTPGRPPATNPRTLKAGITQQLVLPTTALLVICRTFLEDWAVLAAGVVCALSVVAGETPAARPAWAQVPSSRTV